MHTYSGDELARMQQDAIRRVREMQSRARMNVDQANSSYSAQEPASAPPPFAAQTPPPQTGQSPSDGQHSGYSAAHCDSCPYKRRPQSSPFAFISAFGEDRLLILGLIWLLSMEKVDQTLLFALFYIMM